MKQVIIDVAADGSVNMEALGYKGAACEKATKAFEDALGGSVKGRKKKSEYYQQDVANKQRT